jgi:hypothetical protein
MVENCARSNAHRYSSEREQYEKRIRAIAQGSPRTLSEGAMRSIARIAKSTLLDDTQ